MQDCQLSMLKSRATQMREFCPHMPLSGIADSPAEHQPRVMLVYLQHMSTLPFKQPA